MYAAQSPGRRIDRGGEEEEEEGGAGRIERRWNRTPRGVGGWRRKGCRWPGSATLSSRNAPKRSKTEQRTLNSALKRSIDPTSARGGGGGGELCRDSGHRSPGTRLDRFHDTIYHPWAPLCLLFVQRGGGLHPLLLFLSFLHCRSLIYIYMREIDKEGMDAIKKFKFSNHPNEKSWIDSIVSIIREDWSKRIGEKNSERKRVSRKWVTGSKRNKMEGEVEIWEGRERSPLLLLPFSIAYPGIRFFNTSVALSPSLTVLLYFPLPRKKREKENRRRGGFLIGESEIGRPLDRTRAHLVQRFLPAFFSR